MLKLVFYSDMTYYIMTFLHEESTGAQQALLGLPCEEPGFFYIWQSWLLLECLFPTKQESFERDLEEFCK